MRPALTATVIRRAVSVFLIIESLPAVLQAIENIGFFFSGTAFWQPDIAPKNQNYQLMREVIIRPPHMDTIKCSIHYSVCYTLLYQPKKS